MKRAFDLLVSATMLTVLAPLFLLLGLAIKLDNRGPVFYRGVRVGLHGRPFRICEFRSMVPDADKGAASTSAVDERTTRVGRFMRRLKLDELPQLMNVLLGQMSIVGPRPEVRKFVDRYSDDERVILTVRPGITDWASIRFHDEGGIIASSGIADPDEAYNRLIRPEKIRLQLKYVREHSMFTDLRIIGATLFTLIWTRLGPER